MSAATPLDTIVTTADAEPPELPRLISADVFRAYTTMGGQLQRMIELYKALPNVTGRQPLDEDLRELIKNAESLIANAKRLLEANR